MLLLDYLVQKYPTAKRTTLRRMVESRRVLINGRPARRVKDPIGDGDKVEVLEHRPTASHPERSEGSRDRNRLSRSRDSSGRYRPPRNDDSPAPPPFEILHEDPDLIVILKPPGLLTSTTKRERRATVASKLQAYFAATDPTARVGVIHRLDRDASGLLVFSKNTAAYHHLKAQFFRHTVERVYTAVVEGVPQPKSGMITSLLTERLDGRVVPTDDRSKARPAVTNYQTLATIKSPTLPSAKSRTISLLRVTLETGRKHQIRAHLAAVKKTPIVGDPVYGPPDQPATRLLLAATTLAFDHPRTGQRRRFEVKSPKEITRLFPSTSPDAKPSAAP
jgi:23S rRNA pseudouridine1911/1915/1917 synthase